MVPVRIAPSLASAPFTNLASEVAVLEKGGADILHFDLEDGTFVPVMTLGTRLIGQLRPLTQLPFDVHLMIEHPETMIPEVAHLGADSISVHVEACLYPRRTLRLIHDLGKKAGLALNPITPVPDLAYLMPYLDFVVILTTEPEMRDCPFLPATLEKVRTVQEFAQTHHPELDVVADGGIDASNVADAVQAGANVIVAGRGVFGGGHPEENINRMRKAMSIYEHPNSA